ncbi:MAG: 30S ribosomal protein S3 [Candidatus Berkelbacteria bacterium]|nr:MAG: 30S ribosomal protein S3 [Candidatus Berkelbacteria bacterium]QQG52098.1 MAG: 30S ribosomal protein S3 [Candidatus Berkelbacteria bacterium]
MGQKTNPISNRMSMDADWRSKWFAVNKSDFRKYLVDDIKIRDYINKKLNNAGIGRVEIIRSRDRLEIKLTTSKPGLVIGRGGQGINLLKAELQSKFYPQGMPAVRLDITEERKPDLSATLVAQNIGNQIERRIPYRRACKQAIERTMSSGAKGIKILVSGRLNGAEIARNEKFQDGSIPLSRFNIDIDHFVYHAKTTYGVIGVKVWVNRGEREEVVEEK